MTGLQERMKGPRYDCYGPWPVCDSRTFRVGPGLDFDLFCANFDVHILGWASKF